MKRTILQLLCLMLCLGLMAVYVPRAEAMQEGTGEIVEISEVIYIDQVESSESLYSLDADGNVALKSGNYERWIDRLDLTDAQFALDFYAWLEANIDGALVDPTGCATYKSNYVYTAKVNTGTIPFTYDDDPGAAAAEAVTNGLPETLNDVKPYLVAVYSAFDRDHPEVFWLTGGSVSGSSVSYSYSYGSGSGTVKYTQNFYFYLTNSGRNFDVRQESYRTASAVSSMSTQRDAAVEQILSQVTATNTYEQVRQLNRILTTTNCYNSDVSTAPDSAYECTSALLGSTGSAGPVCEGYSRAFKVLCDELEIPCVLVDGMSYNSGGSGPHMWNNVQMHDGNWYAVDVTWNDPVVSGKTGAVSGYESENFLLVGSDTVVNGMAFSASHVVENSVVSGSTCFTNGPVLASSAYTYVPVTSLTLSQTALELEEGDEIQLIATVTPTNASEKTVIWSSDNPSVATVSDGTVTAISKGTAVITAEAGGVSAQCTVTVFHTHIHAGVVTTQPTCTKEGVTTYTCRCGDSYTESIPTVDHNYVDGTCTACGDIEIIASGNSADNVTWVLDGKGMLTISGTGEMITYADDWSAYRERIVTVVIGDGVTDIPDGAFSNCSNLTTVTIPDSVTSVGYFAFSSCSSLERVTIPKDVTTVMPGTFKDCSSLKSISIPDSVTSIGDSAFGGCSSLESLVLPSGITSIESGTFVSCSSLKSITIPNGVTSIGERAFSRCGSLTDVAMPSALTNIGDGAFEFCSSLTGIEIPENVTRIGVWAFASCGSLTDITIPSSVSVIGEGAFNGCEKITRIQFCGSATESAQSVNYPVYYAVFDGVTATAYYPYGNETWTTDVMQNYGGEITWVAYGEPEKFDIDFAQVILGNALNVNFAFPVDAQEDWTSCYAVATKTYADGREDLTVTVPASEWKSATIQGAKHYYFSFANVSGKEMADNIYVTIYNADDEAISNKYTESIRSYVMRILDDQNAETRTMLVDMLNYGSAAQTAYTYGTDDLANGQLSETQKAYGSSTVKKCTDSRVKGANYQGTRLVLKNSILMQFGFSGLTADMTAKIEFTNHRGTKVSETVAPVKLDNGAYAIEVNQIVAADGRIPVTVTVYDANGNVYGTATDSMESYLARMGTTDPLYAAIMMFSDAAYAYLH